MIGLRIFLHWRQADCKDDGLGIERGWALGNSSQSDRPGFRVAPRNRGGCAVPAPALYSTRWEELAAVADWTDAQKIAFLESQFAAQRSYYLSHYASAAFDVLEECGVPAGRLYLDRQADTLLIVDIALLPEWCGSGIGTALLEAMFAEARLSGKGVTISVEKFNPAQRLYRRLGFREYAEDDVYWFMHWSPETDARGGIS
jgi:ribosomal protein S18 acetylase RimI-like enzyme